MNDENDIPLHPSADEVVEARIVAWVLGEASAFEIAELERLCAEKPELAAFHQRMLALQGLLDEAAGHESGDEWKLSEAKAKTIHEAFGDVPFEAVVENKKRPLWKRPQPWVGVAACLAVSMLGWRYYLTGIGDKHEMREETVRTRSALPVFSPAERDLVALSEAIRDQERKVEERRAALSNLAREKGIIYSGQESIFQSQDSQADGNADQTESRSLASLPPGSRINGIRSGDAGITQGGIDAILNAPASPAAPGTADPTVAAKTRGARTRTVPSASASNSTNFGSDIPADLPKFKTPSKKAETDRADVVVAEESDVSDGSLDKAIIIPETERDGVRRRLYMAEGNYNLGKYDDARKDYEAALRADPSNTAARRGLERLATAKSDYYRASKDHTRAELLMEVDKAWELDVPKLGKQGEMDLFAKGVPPAQAGGIGTATGYSMADDLNNLWKLESNLKALEPAADSFSYSLQDEGINVVSREGMAAIPPADVLSDPAVRRNQALNASQFDGPKMGTVALGEKAVDLNEIATAEEAFSTFSLNVSDVSFQLALASLEKSESPDPASIKIEQFYNAVDYGDPAPSGDPIATKIEQSAHPVIPGRNLVRLGVKTASAGRSAAQPLNLTLLIDQSGSMVRDDRRAALEKTLADLSTLLTEKDRVSVIGFSRTPSLLADGIAGNQLGTVTGMMNREAAEAGTNLEEALSLAQQIALRQASHEAGNRIVLFTDGAANLGDADPARLAEKVRTLRQEGVAVDVAGIGADGLNDKLLAELARNGDGRYLLAAGNIAAQLAGAFRPAAEDVKVQVRFNPERVSRYKLIGFEEDRLKKEDFRNDAVDAAELAAEEAAVALYQVELIPDGKGEIGEMSVRFRDAASREMVERSWTIAHDENTPVFDKATPSMQLAGLSMLAGEKLKGGPMTPMIDFRKYNGGIASVREYYANSSKVADMLRLIGLLTR